MILAQRFDKIVLRWKDGIRENKHNHDLSTVVTLAHQNMAQKPVSGVFIIGLDAE